MASDSESERADKQHFFEQLEAQWQASHSGEPIDYALLNQLNSSSFDPESSSSPDKSPFRRSSMHQGNPAQTSVSHNMCATNGQFYTSLPWFEKHLTTTVVDAGCR